MRKETIRHVKRKMSHMCQSNELTERKEEKQVFNTFVWKNWNKLYQHDEIPL